MTDGAPNFCQCEGCSARSKNDGEWLCGKHWKLVPLELRKAFGTAWRLYLKTKAAHADNRPLKRGGEIPTAELVNKLWHRGWWAWVRCKASVRTADGAPPADLVAFMHEIGLRDPDVPPTSLG